MTYETKEIDINGIKLDILSGVNDYNYYSQRTVFEEKSSLLYSLIKEENFINFIDIGANYGFISLLIKLQIPDINCITIEADPRLTNIIKNNFNKNNANLPIIINSVASDENTSSHIFSINPNSTLDNRVNMDNWKKLNIQSITIDKIIVNYKLTGKSFFKIDTQGYEMHILKGMEHFLQNNNDWCIKMEFAPKWLESQNSNPLELLKYLALHYEFAEFPARVQFNTPSIDELFRYKINESELSDFLNYVVSLNRDGLGWVDLIVRR